MTWHIVTMEQPMPGAVDFAHNDAALVTERKTRTAVRYNHLFILTVLSGAVCGCAMRDHFPMKNAATGQAVTCYSGYYRFEEGVPQYRIAEQCMHACERFGFKWIGANEYYRLDPKPPDADVIPFIPPACLT
jgi:hypothetical protein